MERPAPSTAARAEWRDIVARYQRPSLWRSVMQLSVTLLALGATFPLAIRWFASDSPARTRRAAMLYATNTLGAAAGMSASNPMCAWSAAMPRNSCAVRVAAA